MPNQLNRNPPAAVRRLLRQEVGFRCPADCGNPYLTWHHFDPPWAIEQHHRPEGMIALCLDHGSRADASAFTDDQLRQMKRDGRDRSAAVQGRFDWMRRDLLAVVGGNFYYKTLVILEIGPRPCIWFGQDDNGYLLVNFWMPSLVGQPRAQIFENGWIVPPTAADVECPPNGRRLKVWYHNGDRLNVEFFEIPDPTTLINRYQDARIDWANDITFPITGVEIAERATGTPIEFGPRQTRMPGAVMRDCFFSNNGVGVHIGIPSGVTIPQEPT
jgi:hypothetical protein